VSERAHKHTFSKHQVRVDFCHYVIVQRFCTDKECDDVVETEVERDFAKNPMQIVFAREDCARCRVLVYGMEPASWGARA
jgi:hypothetical protein